MPTPSSQSIDDAKEEVRRLLRELSEEKESHKRTLVELIAMEGAFRLSAKSAVPAVDPARITFFSPTEIFEVPYGQLRDWCAQHALNRSMSIADEMRILWRLAKAYGSSMQNEGDRSADARREMEAAYREWCRNRHSNQSDVDAWQRRLAAERFDSNPRRG